MAYQKGHTYHPPKNGISARGKTMGERIAQRAMAMVAREEWPPERFVDYLTKWAMGIDPRAVPDPVTGAVSYDPVSPEMSRWAVKMLRELGYGLPAQHVTLEAEVKAHTMTVTTTVTQGQIRDMPSADRNVLREALRKALHKPGTATVITPVSAPARVLDVPESSTVQGQESITVQHNPLADGDT